MADPQVLQGHRDLGAHPVLPNEKLNPAGQPLSGEPEVKEASPIAQLSAPVYHKVKKDGTKYYPADAPKPRRFQSTIEKLRIQLKSRPGFRDTETGNWVSGDHQAIEFQDFVYVTSDDARIIKIESSRKYGVDIWDSEAKAVTLRKLTDESVIKRVLGDPELAKKLQAELGKEDFIAPAEKKAGRSKKS